MIGPPGDRAANRNVLARAQTTQQRRHRRLQHHEQRGLGIPRQPQQPLMQIRTPLQSQRRPAVAGLGRTSSIRGQIQLFRQFGQRLPPVSQLPIALLAQSLVLPQGVVGVLDRQRRQIGPHSPAARLIGRG